MKANLSYFLLLLSPAVCVAVYNSNAKSFYHIFINSFLNALYITWDVDHVEQAHRTVAKATADVAPADVIE